MVGCCNNSGFSQQDLVFTVVVISFVINGVCSREELLDLVSVSLLVVVISIGCGMFGFVEEC